MDALRVKVYTYSGFYVYWNPQVGMLIQVMAIFTLSWLSDTSVKVLVFMKKQDVSEGHPSEFDHQINMH